MSDWDAGDSGTDYGHVETGQEHESLDQLHQVNAGESDYNSQFGVYEQDHASAESTSFDQGHQVQYTDGHGASYSESDFTSYDHAAAESDHVFAAEGSESSHQSEFSQLDALQARFDSAFAEGTQFSTGGGAGELGVASN